MSWGADAPRLHALWQHRAGRSVLSMARSDWDRLSQGTTGPVRLDIAQTPLAGIASDASVIAAVAYQPSDSGNGEVVVYRHDSADEPTPVNVDKYAVLRNIASDPRLPSLISAASTKDNDNLRRYLTDNVFIVRKNPGRDHWLRELPTAVAGLYRSTSSGTSAA
jgi:hypothetical protein